jgi:hypothetical protein
MSIRGHYHLRTKKGHRSAPTARIVTLTAGVSAIYALRGVVRAVASKVVSG